MLPVQRLGYRTIVMPTTAEAVLANIRLTENRRKAIVPRSKKPR